MGSGCPAAYTFAQELENMLRLFPQKGLDEPGPKNMSASVPTEDAAKQAALVETPAAKTPPIQLPQAGAASKQTERRQMRRAGISLLVRVRTADFTDGNFEEVRTTQNASRKAVYFVTHVDRYYKGMRVRITSPYDPNNGSGNLEQAGEVVRVHRRDVGYGVAIALSCGPQPPASTTKAAPSLSGYAQSVTPLGTESRYSQAPSTTAASHYGESSVASRNDQTSAYAPQERRSANRAPFIAPVDLVDVRTGTRVQARTSDLSAQGCYIDTLNPLEVGSMVRLQIHRSDKVLDAIANVSSRHPGSGMGLVFSELSAPQKALLAMWLTELALPPRGALPERPNPARTSAPASVTAGSPDRATRLIHLLLRKGVLNQSEASELLTDPQ